MFLIWITHLEPPFHRCGITEFLDAGTSSYLMQETERGMMVDILKKVVLKVAVYIL